MWECVWELVFLSNRDFHGFVLLLHDFFFRKPEGNAKVRLN